MEVKAYTSVPVVFAGLSLSHAEAGAFGSAEIRPPVKRGDLDALESGRVVAIIDGELDPVTMLTIDEIRRAIDRGMKVRGAASIGALRAFETRDNGMEGVGWVYDAYCTGRIVGTDEIAVVYEPLSRRPLTVPLVNVRFCLDRLVSGGSITVAEADAAMSTLKSLRVEERGRRGVLLRLAHVFGSARVKAALRLAAELDSNIKKRDAFHLLRTLGARRYPRHHSLQQHTPSASLVLPARADEHD